MISSSSDSRRSFSPLLLSQDRTCLGKGFRKDGKTPKGILVHDEVAISPSFSYSPSTKLIPTLLPNEGSLAHRKNKSNSRTDKTAHVSCVRRGSGQSPPPDRTVFSVPRRKPPPQDSSISSTKRRIIQMRAESRQAKVGRLKDQINQGLYHVDARAVAEAILVHERRNHCLASPAVDISIQMRPVGEGRCVARSRRVWSHRQSSVSSPSRGRKLSRRRRGNLRASLF
jgi:anti-sigma28 factor (negative regulator of flagellin synthesis)